MPVAFGSTLPAWHKGAHALESPEIRVVRWRQQRRTEQGRQGLQFQLVAFRTMRSAVLKMDAHSSPLGRRPSTDPGMGTGCRGRADCTGNLIRTMGIDPGQRAGQTRHAKPRTRVGDKLAGLHATLGRPGGLGRVLLHNLRIRPVLRRRNACTQTAGHRVNRLSDPGSGRWLGQVPGPLCLPCCPSQPLPHCDPLHPVLHTAAHARYELRPSYFGSSRSP